MVDVTDTFRPLFSLDFDDIISLLVASGALATAFRMKRTSTRANTHSETVDADVLSRFLSLSTQLSELAAKLAKVELKLENTEAELKEIVKVEEFLRASLYEKDKIIRTMRKRIKHLEDVLLKAGLNGDQSSI